MVPSRDVVQAEGTWSSMRRTSGSSRRMCGIGADGGSPEGDWSPCRWDHHLPPTRLKDRDLVDGNPIPTHPSFRQLPPKLGVVGLHHQRREGVHVGETHALRVGHRLDEAIQGAVSGHQIRGAGLRSEFRVSGGQGRRIGRDRHGTGTRSVSSWNQFCT